jgi:predicted nucleotidyltransferase
MKMKASNDIWINRFKKLALPVIVKEFKPENIFLFGSRVSGNPREDSDIDVILVSSLFSGIPFLKRMPLVLKKLNFGKHIDMICYSPEEFRKNRESSSVINTALIEGEKLI